MRLITLSSDSGGNGYLLKTKSGEVLIIEAGVKLRKVKKALDYDLSRIVGCIISHEHSDHSKYLPEYILAGIPCFGNEGTRKAFYDQQDNSGFFVMEQKKTKEIGEFLIKPFPLRHDVENYGYLIHHYESGLICFLTDTAYCPYRFKGLNNILVEANYSDDIIDRRLMDKSASLFVRNRVITNHMEFENTKEFLKANDMSKVNNIVLLHLSMDNSNQERFRREIVELIGKNVHIADSDLNIELNKTGIS